LIVCKSDARYAICMANKFLYAFCADDVPDSNGCIVTTSQKPLAFN